MTEPNRNAILDAACKNAWESGQSFTLRNHLYRGLWWSAWALFASWTPPPLHGWRRFLLRMFGARLAPTSRVYGSAHIWDPRNLEMGAYSCIGPRVICYSMDRISLGQYSLVSQGAHLCSGSHDITQPNMQLIARPIVIGDRAWIAADAFIGPGVTVGEGAVLGARACTFRDLDPLTVYVGNPARGIKVRGIVLAP